MTGQMTHKDTSIDLSSNIQSRQILNMKVDGMFLMTGVGVVPVVPLLPCKPCVSKVTAASVARLSK